MIGTKDKHVLEEYTLLIWKTSFKEEAAVGV
jgi:hypothetical protein